MQITAIFVTTLKDTRLPLATSLLYHSGPEGYQSLPSLKRNYARVHTRIIETVCESTAGNVGDVFVGF